MENINGLFAQTPTVTSAPKRESIGKRMRFSVFHRDAFTCQYCGRRPPTVVLELDHIHPVSKGGDSSADNLVTSCADCNSGKSDKVLSDRPARMDADEKYLEMQQEIAEASRFLEAKAHRDVLNTRLVEALQEYWCLFFTNKNPGDDTFLVMLEEFSVSEIHSAMVIAAKRNRWKPIGYWNEIVSYIFGVLNNTRRDQVANRG
jgi:hypothetical protein